MQRIGSNGVSTMSLLSIWRSSKDEFLSKRVQQIISIAGDGKLCDNSATCDELREYLSVVPSHLVFQYSHECLEDRFEQSGFVLQDIVNEIGTRLGFTITRGLYRGRQGRNGFDGLWSLKSGHKIVIEVKTTDAYAINLDTIAAYRRTLVASGEASLEGSSILLVVGRQDTGGLEAQIRGSRFAWDMRIVSINSLIRLLELKESMDDPAILEKISDILIPQEFTRLDRIIDIVFSTAEEAASVDDLEEIDATKEDEESAIADDEKAPKFHPLAFHKECIEKASELLGIDFVKESRSIYIDKAKTRRLWVAVSKQHGNMTRDVFWFALHPHQCEALEEFEESYALLGCGTSSRLFLIPYRVLATYLDGMWTTVRDERKYWHVKLEGFEGKYTLLLKKGVENPDITEYMCAEPELKRDVLFLPSSK